MPRTRISYPRCGYLRRLTSGLTNLHAVIDAPGGGGKIPLLPKYVISMSDEELVLLFAWSMDPAKNVIATVSTHNTTIPVFDSARRRSSLKSNSAQKRSSFKSRSAATGIEHYDAALRLTADPLTGTRMLQAAWRLDTGLAPLSPRFACAYD